VLSATSEQNASERLAEVSVAAGVDDGVERRVRVARPEQSRHHGFGWFPAPRTHRPGQVPGEERHPADQERTDYDSQRPGRLVLAPHSVSPRPRTLRLTLTLTLRVGFLCRAVGVGDS
jgi:hypothetical protein